MIEEVHPEQQRSAGGGVEVGQGTLGEIRRGVGLGRGGAALRGGERGDVDLVERRHERGPLLDREDARPRERDALVPRGAEQLWQRTRRASARRRLVLRRQQARGARDQRPREQRREGVRRGGRRREGAVEDRGPSRPRVEPRRHAARVAAEPGVIVRERVGGHQDHVRPARDRQRRRARVPALAGLERQGRAVRVAPGAVLVDAVVGGLRDVRPASSIERGAVSPAIERRRAVAIEVADPVGRAQQPRGQRALAGERGAQAAALRDERDRERRERQDGERPADAVERATRETAPRRGHRGREQDEPDQGRRAEPWPRQPVDEAGARHPGDDGRHEPSGRDGYDARRSQRRSEGRVTRQRVHGALDPRERRGRRAGGQERPERAPDEHAGGRVQRGADRADERAAHGDREGQPHGEPERRRDREGSPRGRGRARAARRRLAARSGRDGPDPGRDQRAQPLGATGDEAGRRSCEERPRRGDREPPRGRLEGGLTRLEGRRRRVDGRPNEHADQREGERAAHPSERSLWGAARRLLQLPARNRLQAPTPSR
jgi:hypothetical protein